MDINAIGPTLLGTVGKLGAFYVGTVGKALSTDFANGWERALVTLYIVSVGYMILSGRTQRWKEWVGSIVFLLIFQGTVIESSVYLSYVAGPWVSFVEGMTTWFVQTGSAGIGGSGLSTSVQGTPGILSVMGGMIAKVIQAVMHMTPHGNFMLNAWEYLKVGTLSLVLLVIFVILYLATFLLLGISLLILDVLIILGPIWLFFACFKETRFVAWAWVRAVLNYSMLMIVVGVAASFAIFVSLGVVNQLATTDPASTNFTMVYLSALLVGAFSIYLVLKAADIAAALTGGQAGSTTAIAAGMSVAGGALLAGTRMAGGRAWNSAAGQAARGWAAGQARNLGYGAGGAAMNAGASVARAVGRAFSARRGVQR